MLSIRTLGGAVHALAGVDGGTTVGAVKALIHAKEGIPAEQQRLIFEGKQLEDGLALSDYDVQEILGKNVSVLLVASGAPRSRVREVSVLMRGATI
jgi:hypothetical protein